MPHDPYRGLYIHLPFCASKCHYCDFDSLAYRRDDPYIGEYVEGLVRRIRQLSKEGELTSIRTIYLGGGTPTHIGAGNLGSLMYALSVSLDLSQVEEYTVEANPESLTESLVKDMWALGANRLSLGVQTFDDELLRAIGRIHTSREALDAIKTAQTRFENVSIDLMCGLPEQTQAGVEKDVQRAIERAVTHISLYPLTLEKGTKLYRKRRRLRLPSEDVQASMMESAQDLLEEAGFRRYEVASYARPGFESKHNQAYWTSQPYLGVGRSAVTMTQNEQRRMRVRDDQIEDDLDPAQMAAEDAMLAMRMTQGLSKQRAEQLARALPDLLPCLRSLEGKGLVAEDADAWRPTQTGWLLGNELFGELLLLAP